ASVVQALSDPELAEVSESSPQLAVTRSRTDRTEEQMRRYIMRELRGRLTSIHGLDGFNRIETARAVPQNFDGETPPERVSCDCFYWVYFRREVVGSYGEH
ncbi:MAG: hypothetical protein VX938_05310, partial [Myxococcota bacterium]|nr:hypothetical protein [Myxococcota bacterium]